jgi:hypothetical protein
MSRLCKDCKHFNGVALCLHSSNGDSLVTGRVKPAFSAVKRNHENDCGQSGLYFEPVEKQQPLTKFFGVFG